MKVKELIEKLSSFNSDSDVVIQYMDADAYGSCWEDVEDFDENDIRAKNDIVVIDIT